MPITLSHGFELAPGRCLRLDTAQGRELVVTQGRVWLSCTGDHSEDAFIAAGHSLRLGAGAVVECDGTEPARLRLLPARRPWTARVGRVLAALGRSLPGSRPRPAAPRHPLSDGG